MPCKYCEFTMHIRHIFCIYSWYIHSKYCLLPFHCSSQPQQWPHRVWQGLCLATPGNDARHQQGRYCGPDIWVACWAANPAVPLVHRHPCCADQWLNRERYTHSVCWQNGLTLSCIYGFFIYGRRWGVHCHYVSHDAVHNVLVSQGTTAGLRPCVPFQRHTGDSRWAGNRASATAESRWNCTWQVQGQGMFLMAYIMLILYICKTYTMYILCISKNFELNIYCICHVYVR